eukprot:COSAG06_NODE_46104_length_349_cov_0.980000_1_plen_36_part_10
MSCVVEYQHEKFAIFRGSKWLALAAHFNHPQGSLEP